MKISSKECAKQIDEKLDAIVFTQYNEEGKVVGVKGNVCCVCDKFLLPNQVDFISEKKLFDAQDSSLKYNGHGLNNSASAYLHDYYSYTGPMSKDWMKGSSCLISPRTCARSVVVQKLRGGVRNRETGCEYMICRSCKDAVCKKKIPIRGIGNSATGGL